MSGMNESVRVGTLPAVGEVPARMFAQVVRQDRFGEPRDAFQVEEVDTPSVGPGEVLLAVPRSM
jgi:crotonyl-CoA carboxylase/reductase